MRPLLWIGVPVLLLGLVRPWTIRPIEGQKPAAFDAPAFALSAWPRLVRDATQTAADVSERGMTSGASTGKARFVKGTGVVEAVDRQSRVGVLRVRLSGAGSEPGTAVIQIGPVIRGTALRDASGFIQFSQFTNQIDYAGAANALNDYALRTVINPLSLETLHGRTIAFVGAAVGTEIVPVSIEVIGSPAR